MTAPKTAPDRAQRRLLRNIALAAGIGAFAVSFPLINAVLPNFLLWLTGERPGAPVPPYGAPAVARIAIAAMLALCVGGTVFASLARGVIFESRALASPAPENPVTAAITGGLLGLGLYVVAAAALPAVAPYARWPGEHGMLTFILAPAALFFFWRILGLAAEGAAAQRRARERARNPFTRRGGV